MGEFLYNILKKNINIVYKIDKLDNDLIFTMASDSNSIQQFLDETYFEPYLDNHRVYIQQKDIIQDFHLYGLIANYYQKHNSRRALRKYLRQRLVCAYLNKGTLYHLEIFGEKEYEYTKDNMKLNGYQYIIFPCNNHTFHTDWELIKKCNKYTSKM